MISFDRVSHAYAQVASVDDLTLRVEEGQTVALIGPSGCGKSTLLKLAVGLVGPRSRRVMIAGSILNADNVLQVRQRIGYVIQSGGLFPHLAAADNVTLAARHFGPMAPSEDRACSTRTSSRKTGRGMALGSPRR